MSGTRHDMFEPPERLGYPRGRSVLSRLEYEAKNTQVVIFAGGLGKRMGSSQPKALIEVGGEALIDRCVEFFAGCGYYNFVFLLGHGHQEIKEHIGNGSGYGIRAAFSVDQQAGQGRASSLLQALRSGKVSSRMRSVITFPDDIFTDESLPVRLILEHMYGVERMGAWASLVLTHGRRWPYGVGRVDASGLIKRFEEKPFIKQPTSVGLYVFEPRVYQMMDQYAASKERWGIEETLIPRMAEEGKLYSVFVPSDSWLPVNTQKDLEQVERYLLKMGQTMRV